MKTNQPHIINLIERCKKHDKNAQLELYKCYYKAMYNASLRILNDRFEAEDVMQESFLSVFTKINSYKGEVTFGAWLKRIVINKSLTQLKKSNRYQEVKMEVIPSNENEDLSIDYSSLKANKVYDCIQSLKDNYKLVLNLHLIEGYDYEEISEILNYTNENVRTTVSRAKKKLKQVILASDLKTQIYGQ